MPALVWLVGVPEGLIRVGGHGAKFCRLLQPQWLQDLSAAHDAAPLSIRQERGESRTLYVLGLCVLDPGHTYEGPLTPYSREESLLFEFYGRRTDTLTYQVVDLCVLAQPAAVASAASVLGSLGRKDRHMTRHFQQFLYTSKTPLAFPVDDWLDSPIHLNEGARTAREWLHASWPQLAAVHEEGTGILMVQQVWQVAQLLCARAWTFVGLLGRWCQPNAEANRT